jgi:uncharacterized damage-inducible protein DinB
MITTALKTLFSRDLKKLRTEIESYRNETALWKVEKMIPNPAGNLCLHLVGNLNAYIGAGLAKTSYVRQRALEFSLKDIPRAELLQRIDDTLLVVETALDSLTDEMLQQDFPVVIWDKPTSIDFTLLHLATHLNYHLGQINYHRRLTDV